MEPKRGPLREFFRGVRAWLSNRSMPRHVAAALIPVVVIGVVVLWMVSSQQSGSVGSSPEEVARRSRLVAESGLGWLVAGYLVAVTIAPVIVRIAARWQGGRSSSKYDAPLPRLHLLGRRYVPACFLVFLAGFGLVVGCVIVFNGVPTSAEGRFLLVAGTTAGVIFNVLPSLVIWPAIQRVTDTQEHADVRRLWWFPTKVITPGSYPDGRNVDCVSAELEHAERAIQFYRVNGLDEPERGNRFIKRQCEAISEWLDDLIAHQSQLNRELRNLENAVETSSDVTVIGA